LKTGLSVKKQAIGRKMDLTGLKQVRKRVIPYDRIKMRIIVRQLFLQGAL